MIRFFSLHNDAVNGTHTALTFTSTKRTLAEAFAEVEARHKVNARYGAKLPMFYDFGPGEDLRRVDKIHTWNQ